MMAMLTFLSTRFMLWTDSLERSVLWDFCALEKGRSMLHLQLVIKVYSTSLIALNWSNKSGSWVDRQESASWALVALQVSQATRCAHVVGHDWVLLEACSVRSFSVWTTMCLWKRKMSASMQSMAYLL